MRMPAWHTKFGVLPMRLLRKFFQKFNHLVYALAKRLPMFGFVSAYEGKNGSITFRTWFFQRILGFNRDVYWGTHFTSRVTNPRAIVLGVHTNPGIEPGCYIQGVGSIKIGDYTNIAMNCAIISGNHDIHDGRKHHRSKVEIGSYCWIGANCSILPGISLGDFTIVGAGSVVSKSFRDGYCVLVGNPARKIRDLDPAKCIRYQYRNPHVGYMTETKFSEYRRLFLFE